VGAVDCDITDWGGLSRSAEGVYVCLRVCTDLGFVHTTVYYETIQIQSVTVVNHLLGTRWKSGDIVSVGHIISNTCIFA
jgi:hypothetical protein